jgi:hypothetical protein
MYCQGPLDDPTIERVSVGEDGPLGLFRQGRETREEEQTEHE